MDRENTRRTKTTPGGQRVPATSSPLLPNVADVRNMGLVAGIELESIPGKPGTRAFDVFLKCFEKNVLIRTTGDIIALSPPLIIEKAQIDTIVETLRDVLKTLE